MTEDLGDNVPDYLKYESASTYYGDAIRVMKEGWSYGLSEVQHCAVAGCANEGTKRYGHVLICDSCKAKYSKPVPVEIVVNPAHSE